MTIQVERRDGAPERAVLAGMVTDRSVLAAVSQKWVPGMFASRWANLAGGWAVDYFRKYGKAPGSDIGPVFDEWALGGDKDKDTVKLLERFLNAVSDESSPAPNAAYLIDQASAVFDRVRLRQLLRDVEAHLEANDLVAANQSLSASRRVEMGQGSGIEPLSDKEAIRRAFESKQDPLILYPGALGAFIGESMERDGFIAFEGPEKRGKTFMLLDTAFRAVLQGRQVAFFEVGDMSQDQIIRRLMCRVSKHPLKAGPVRWPTRIDPGTPCAEVTHKILQFDKDLSWRAAWKSCQGLLAGKLKSDQPLLRLSVHPNSSISVKGVEAVIENWGRDGWVPDVVVVDYADILAPVNAKEDSRDQINTTWKALRSLSQSLHCLVVTATQTDAASYTATTITKSNFSGDKRKNAHISGMIGLNATDLEKAEGLLRLNWVALREGEFDERKCCTTAGCLALANPCVRSTF